MDNMAKAGAKQSITRKIFSEEARGLSNLYCTRKDVQNHVARIRHAEIKLGDAQFVYNYFTKMQMQDSHFFYSMQVDSES